MILPFSKSRAADAFGTFAAVKGTVHVETATEKTPARVGEKIFQGSTVITSNDNARAKIIMSDRSVIHISPSSKIKIASYSESQKTKNVELQLSEGKVRNEVKGSYDDNNKFLIKTPTAVAGVRGTDFIVNHNVKTNTTNVTTLKGTVFFTALRNGVPAGEPIILKQNETSSASAESSAVPAKKISDVEKSKIESDTKSDGNASGEKRAHNNEGTTLNPNKDAGKTKLSDTKDLNPDNFNQVPNSPNFNPPPNAMPGKFMPPPPNPRLNDAIRDKADRTKIKIEPKPPTSP